MKARTRTKAPFAGMRFTSLAAALTGAACLAACGSETASEPQDDASAALIEAEDETLNREQTVSPEILNERIDKFSYTNFDEIRVRHLDLDLTVDFETKTLSGIVVMDLDYPEPGARRLILDTNDLTITNIEARVSEAWEEAPYILGDDDPLLGAKLTIDLPDGADAVLVEYSTSPNASGLQWVSPEGTAGKEFPFMYSQAQAIHARSITPIQDTPAVRITYSARLKTPEGLVALMSAAQDPDYLESGEKDGDYSFTMPQPIPPYLIAIAVGDLEFQSISETMGVYAESYIVGAAAKEFEDTPQMEVVTEALYGPYRWGRYDMIVLPPSFPYGGMENPRLSFLTPTLVAGDKSLTNVVAHELAHSWSGNLVTNATWRDAWLNEGFTSYVENRIMEAVFGEERATMERFLDKQSLIRTVEELERPALSRLKLPADLKDPDEAFTLVAYLKGAFFLKFLEERYGRETFDPFLKAYFNEFAFKSIITEDFLQYLEENLMNEHPGAASMEEIEAWVYKEGIPDTIEMTVSDKFTAVDNQLADWFSGNVPAEDLETTYWTTHEWLHFINTLPVAITPDQLGELDSAMSLSGNPNAEIAFAWYMQAIKAGYEPAFEPLNEFLVNVGRGKFIYRLYRALAETDRRTWAMGVYDQARSGYHPIAQGRIDTIFEETAGE
ncbi:MAG: M1 family metallopeptidase [Pseudomonadota bacterium]